MLSWLMLRSPSPFTFSSSWKKSSSTSNAGLPSTGSSKSNHSPVARLFQGSGVNTDLSQDHLPSNTCPSVSMSDSSIPVFIHSSSLPSPTPPPSLTSLFHKATLHHLPS